MAKFLKSIFHSTDRRKSSQYEHEGDEDKNDSPQMGTRRQLSISRSGKMRQANKKRHSLTLELYGENIQIEAVEKPKSVEYHVHSPSLTTPPLGVPDPTRFGDSANMEDIHPVKESTEITNALEVALETNLRTVAVVKSPDEEIDSAFEIIDKS